MQDREAEELSGDVSPMLAAVLSYLARGWSVVPLVPKTKRPAVTLAPYLNGAQRMKENEARVYWTANPDAGVAIVMGAPSRLIAIDLDPRNGADLEQAQRDCPTGLVARTGGGGLHLFVRHPGGHVPKGKTNRPGVDRQSDGSYVVAAPSVHPDTGESYRWVSEGQPGELPAWTTERAVPAPKEGGEPSQPWVAETLKQPEMCTPGTQEQTLARLCWWAARNLDRDIADVVLGNWLARVPLGNAHWAWTADDLATKLDIACEKRALDPGVAGPLVNDAAKKDDGPRELRFVSYDELATQVREMSKRPWLIPGWLRARGLFLIAGASHFGKTWLSIDLAVSAAIGGKFLNAYAVDPGEDGARRVLYIVGEDDAPDFMERRLDAVLASKGAQPRTYFEGDEEGAAKARAARERNDAFRANFRVHVERQFLFGDKGAQAALLDVVKEFKPSLLILDPLKDMVPGEDVDGFFAGAVVHTRFLRDLRDTADCCIGIVHHTTKKLEWDKADAGISGRTEFIASFEHRFICFRAPVGTDGENDEGTPLRWTRGVVQRRVKASAPLGPVAIRYAGLGDELLLQAHEVSDEDGQAIVNRSGASTDLAERAVQIIATSGPISGNAIERHLKGQKIGVQRSALFETLRQLMDAGRVQQTSAGYTLAGLVPEVVPAVPGSKGAREPEGPMEPTESHTGEEGGSLLSVRTRTTGTAPGEGPTHGARATRKKTASAAARTRRTV